MTFIRTQNRAVNELRPVKLTRNFTVHAEGSVLVEFGDTRVLCTASVEDRVDRKSTRLNSSHVD